MFAEEKPSLLPLPLEPFRYYQYGERTVHLDGCVEVEAAYYSAPPGWIGRIVQVQWDGLHVRLLDPRTGQLLREHLRQQRGRHRIKDEDRPKRTPLGTVQLLARAAQVRATHRSVHQSPVRAAGRSRGAPHSGHSVLHQKVRRRPRRRCLRRRAGTARLTTTASCAAIWNADRSRRSVCGKSIRLIRQLTLYRDLIEERTQQDNQEPNQ